MLNIQDSSKEDKIIVIPDKLPLWEQKLEERGILNAAKKLAGVKPMNYKGISGWSYPLYQANGKLWVLPDGRPSIRFKAFDKSSKISYAWGHSDQGKDDVKKLEHCNYYWLPGTKQAILDNGGTLFITAGEPDMWTLLECGIRNVTTFFGESNIPDKETLIRNMHSLGVKLVKYLPDPDAAGMKAAQKLHDRLYGSDIGFTALKLSDSDTQDVNDLFRAVEFDKKSMVRLILEAERYEFELPVMALPDVGQSKSGDFEPPDGLLQELYQVMGLKKQDGKEFSEKITCPKHDDKTPSAQWNYRTLHLDCFAGCESTGWKATAELYGVDWRKYLDTAKPQLEKPAAPEEQPIDIPIFSSDQSMDAFEERLEGAHVTPYAPVPMPFSVLHKLGGYAQVMMPRKLIGILGLSGGGKTSFMETCVDFWRQWGIHCMWWGSEWSWKEYTDRAIQRQGGFTITDMAKHETWLAEDKQRQMGQYTTDFGKQVTLQQQQKARDIIAKMRAWRGKVYYIDKLNITLEQMLGAAQIKIDALKKEGHIIRVFIWDYAQLIALNRAYSDKERINISIAKIKSFCADNNLVGVIASQPNKSDSSEVKRTSEHTDSVLTSESANYLREDAFNLFMTLNPQYKEGKMTNRGIINISKNSGGRRGRISVKMDLEHLRWLDELHHKE